MILALRFVFRLLGANQGNSFILFLYQISQVFVAPFNGIFHDQALGTRSVFELSSTLHFCHLVIRQRGLPLLIMQWYPL